VELPLDEASADLIQKLAVQYDEPMADSSMIPTYLLANTVARHCKVVLGGDGGDELFGGYLAYQSALKRERMRRKLPPVARSLIAAAARNLLPGGAKGRNALMSLGGSTADGIAQSAIWTDPTDYPRVSPWLSRRPDRFSPARWRRDLVEEVRGLPGAGMAADFRSYLPDDILVKVDRASMLCSLEVRAPFLDRRIIEFAYQRIPNRLRAALQERKILLRRLAKRLLPPELDIDRKQGFTIPISEWLTPRTLEAWKEDCREQIRLIVSEAWVDDLMRRRHQLAGEHNLYAVILLTMWMRHYRIAV
jgi:asparagine synthase (glutamine-hydrolysing)